MRGWSFAVHTTYLKAFIPSRRVEALQSCSRPALEVLIRNTLPHVLLFGGSITFGEFKTSSSDSGRVQGSFQPARVFSVGVGSP